MGSQEQGALTEAVYYILLTLVEPLHGYGIMQRVKTLSNQRVNLGPGTLYGALNTLLEKGWIQSATGAEESSRQKAYVVTELGLATLARELVRLEELLGHGQEILDAYRKARWSQDLEAPLAEGGGR